MPITANDPQGAFAINLFLEAAQGFFHWLAFFESDFSQFLVTSFPGRDAWLFQPVPK